ncbi:MAG: toll/interleukin-1 receptor domain-containing protein [Aestuariivirgaceae bacterium]
MDSTAPGGPKLEIFVCHAHADVGFANELVEGLDYDGRFSAALDPHALDEGGDWRVRRGAMIANADTIVFVLSPHAVQSGIFAAEAAYARELSKRVQPVLYRPLGDASMPVSLADISIIRFDEDRSFMEGLKSLTSLLATNADWLRTHTQLFARAREWQQAGHPTSHLLTGTDIAAAKNWTINRPEGAPLPTDLHLSFIKASEEMASAPPPAATQAAPPTPAPAGQEPSLSRANRFYAVIAILLAVAAALATWLALEARKQADAAKSAAMVQTQAAERAKVEAVIQSKRVEGALKTVHASLCMEAKQVTQMLATTNDVAVWDSKFDVFWILYGGPMIALEQLENALADDAKNAVVTAMIEFGKELGTRGEPYEARARGLPRRTLLEKAGAISKACDKV